MFYAFISPQLEKVLKNEAEESFMHFKAEIVEKKNCTVAILLHESKSVQVPMRTLVQ